MEHATANNKKWRKNNPEKTRAHTIVWWEMRNGRLPKQPCKVCGNTKTHAHHEDYSKPLDIMWLCAKCHYALHKAKRPHKEPKKYYIKKGYNNVGKQIAYKKINHLEEAKTLRQEGKSYSQIAQALNISKGTAYKWLNDVPYI